VQERELSDPRHAPGPIRPIRNVMGMGSYAAKVLGPCSLRGRVSLCREGRLHCLEEVPYACLRAQDGIGAYAEGQLDPEGFG